MARDGLTKIELNDAGIRDLLTSTGVQADLLRRGQAIAAAAGEGHRVDLNIESRRASVIVVTTSFRAMQNEATHRGLTRAIDAGR
jgi:hypothetical protein